VKVESRAPATVTVRIEPITSRDVAVQARFANSPPTGTVAGDPAITPSQVRVIGAASQVARIAALYATVGFGDAVTDLVQSVQPRAVDASGATIDGLTVDPRSFSSPCQSFQPRPRERCRWSRPCGAPSRPGTGSRR